MKQKLFSVIIPTYNRVALITTTLDSVKTQSYRPIEIIVVDDGSTDDTVTVLKEWIIHHEQEDFVIKYLRQDNAGVSVA
ncbi:MAG: glycosyltransferase family 2 protein, partial [Kiritimatiellae bacterium]|nr:glycosyltransferase family 2 protein [Kiritimatiellia bacterium]